jgi:hypothetical protein
LSPESGSEQYARSIGLLSIVALVAVVPRLLAGLSDPITYDGYWHLFIARNLVREYRSLAHPPLFPLLLKASDAIHHSRLSYEAVSIASGAGAVFLFGRILQKLRTSPAVPVLGALAFAFFPSAIRMSSVLESYMLCVLFVLAAFLAYLDLVRPDPPAVPRRSRVAFASYASLALLSHYVAGLFFAACLAAPLLVAVVRPSYRHAFRRALKRRYAADAATLLIPAAVGGLLFWFLARPWVRSLNHLPEFYFQPGGETAASFLVRNLANTFNLFSPFTVARHWTAILLLGVFALVVFATSVTGNSPEESLGARAMPSAILLLLLAIGMAGGLLGRYPFGGAMRHQFLLLVFGLLAGFVAFDRLLGFASPILRVLLVVLCASAITANTVQNLRAWWTPGPDPFDAEARTFWSEFPNAHHVHLDQFNLIGFFAQHHDWLWTFLGRAAGNPSLERYEISREKRRLTVVAHRDLWNMDFRDPSLYDALAGSRSASDPLCLEIFCVRQPLPGRPANADKRDLDDRITELAPYAGLHANKLLVRGDDVFGDFCAGRVGAARPSPWLTSIVPAGTHARIGFQVQPNGDSAISVLGRGFLRGAVVFLAERALNTTYGNSGWITAVVPSDLYAQPGRLSVRVVNPDDQASNVVWFEVAP